MLHYLSIGEVWLKTSFIFTRLCSLSLLINHCITTYGDLSSEFGYQSLFPKATFSYAIDALNAFGLAYLHLMEPNEFDLAARDVFNPVTPYFRQIFKGTLITNGGYDHPKGDSILASGDADLVSFGKLFLANPDLPKRFELNAELNTPDPRKFYSPSEKGYTDYPFLELQATGEDR